MGGSLKPRGWPKLLWTSPTDRCHSFIRKKLELKYRKHLVVSRLSTSVNRGRADIPPKSRYFRL